MIAWLIDWSIDWLIDCILIIVPFENIHSYNDVTSAGEGQILSLWSASTAPGIFIVPHGQWHDKEHWGSTYSNLDPHGNLVGVRRFKHKIL